MTGAWKRFLAENWNTAATCAFLVIAFAAVIELSLGRVPWCTCGYVKLWHGVASSSENSQHLSDYYTFSHIIHGIGFYFLLRHLARRFDARVRFVFAVALEAAWEILENTPWIIDRYRSATVSLDYYGDSVLNSMSDIMAMMFGYWLARRIPVWTSILLVIAMELIVGAIIRDNLILNIVMLLYPSEAIRRWQMGG